MNDDIEALTADIPAEILAILANAEAPYTDKARAEHALQAAVEQAPDNLALRSAAYTFYFYANRLHEAMPHAEACLAIAAKALGVPADWRLVGPDSAGFSGFERPQRTYLRSLVALGYCRARLGDREAGAQSWRHRTATSDPVQAPLRALQRREIPISTISSPLAAASAILPVAAMRGCADEGSASDVDKG